MKQHDQDSVPRAISSGNSLAWLDRLSHWLIHYAAGNAPASLAERLEEEWLADRARRPSALSRLRFALGCCWAIRVIAHEHCASGVAVASTALGGKLMIDYLRDDSGLFSRRPMTVVLVVALHIVVFYGLMTSLNFNITKLISSPLQNQVVHEPHPQVLPPLPPPPTFTHSKVEAIIPEYPQTRDVEESEGVIPQPRSIQLPQAPTMPPHVVTRSLGAPGSGFPNTDDFYPSAAKRMEEQGVATVRVCVDMNGRLTSEPTTVESSGSVRLDQGALQLAKAGSGHYRASTEDGRPVNSCFPFRVRFQLRN
jgi:periplasmic protein TonB